VARKHYINHNRTRIWANKRFARRNILSEEILEKILEEYRKEHPLILQEEIKNPKKIIKIIPLADYSSYFDEIYPIDSSLTPEQKLEQWKQRYYYILTHNNYFKSKD
jgi:hypothetical protein